jgi:hypothetical protein
MQCDDSVPDSEAFIESQTGVRRGDPLAAMLFSLTMHKVYDAVARFTGGGCYAFADDGNFIGTVEECWHAWGLLPSQLSTLGMTVNTGKSELTCFHIDSVQDTSDQIALSHFQSSLFTINDRSMRLLGCVVGADDINIAETLNRDRRFRTDQLAAFRRIRHLRKQAGMLALQHLTGVVITNRLRAMPPAATLQHATAYDAAVLSAAHSIVGITAVDGDKYDQQLQMPLILGGFGLTSAVELRMPSCCHQHSRTHGMTTVR